MKRILILEISGSGHHLSYLRRILESGILDAAHVIVAGPSGLTGHRELSDLGSRCELHELLIEPREQARLLDLSSVGLIRREFALRKIYGRAWRRACCDGPIDLVILPQLDGCANAIALRGSPFGGTPLVAISMRTQFHLCRMGVAAPDTVTRPLREWLFRRLLKLESLKALLTIDPTLAGFAARNGRSEFAKVRLLPDACNTYDLIDKGIARAQLGIPDHAKLILAYGALSERKGIFSLMRAMTRDDCPKNAHLLLAGNQDNGVKRFLDGPIASRLLAEGRLHLRPGYVPEEDVPALLSASDVMWVGYIDFYTMSNILVLAARHDLQIIASDQGVIGYLASQHNIGLMVNPRSEDSVIEALRNATDPLPSMEEQVARAHSAFAAYTDAAFHRVMIESVAAAAPGLFSDQ
jgi:glycosyltransferase involved in cell wall biosynthesis